MINGNIPTFVIILIKRCIQINADKNDTPVASSKLIKSTEAHVKLNNRVIER